MNSLFIDESMQSSQKNNISSASVNVSKNRRGSNESHLSNISEASCNNKFPFIQGHSLPQGIPSQVSLTFTKESAASRNENHEYPMELLRGRINGNMETNDSNASVASSNDDEMARMMTSVMTNNEKSSKLGMALAERATIINSINWLGNHVPGCVLAELDEEIEILLRQEQEERRQSNRRPSVTNGNVNEMNFLESPEGLSSQGFLSQDKLALYAKTNIPTMIETEPERLENHRIFQNSRSINTKEGSSYNENDEVENSEIFHSPPTFKLENEILDVLYSSPENHDSIKTLTSAIISAEELRSKSEDQNEYPAKNEYDSDFTKLENNITQNADDKPKSKVKKRQQGQVQNRTKPMVMPFATKNECALLFIDISGFTKLSSRLDVEHLSKTINCYFQMIVDEVSAHGGDILKFAGDALFAEWRINSESERDARGPMSKEECVVLASICGAKIVAECADYPVYERVNSGSHDSPIAFLNVHCGVGVGEMTGVHVGDDEKKREYLIIGHPIDQVAEAEGFAKLGELAASPEAWHTLEKACFFNEDYSSDKEKKPKLIASARKCYFSPKQAKRIQELIPGRIVKCHSFPYQSKLSYEYMDTPALKHLQKLISLYVHPVVVRDEVAASDNPNSQWPSFTLEKNCTQERHRAEAELRIVYTMFIMPLVDAKITGNSETDNALFKLLNNIMKLVSLVLDRFQGHIRQFIVDDKGVVLIVTFGLRGSTFPNMISERAMPATIFLHNALQSELGVENRIGGTVGKVYCGVVGGIKRHEFAVLGPSVNLSARLMASSHNPGIVVDNAVRMKVGNALSFRALPPVKAKGYVDPVNIFEPLCAAHCRWGKVNPNFVGRRCEIKKMCYLANDTSNSNDGHSKLVLLTGESGSGKSAVVVKAIATIRKLLLSKKRHVIITKNISNEGDTLVPFSLFSSIFLDVLKELRSQNRDETFSNGDDGSTGELSLDQDWDEMSYLSVSTSNTMFDAADQFGALCKEMNAPPEFQEIVGRHLLGFDTEKPKEKMKGSLEAIIDFMADAFLRCTSHADIVILALDDVHCMDELSWKVVQKIFEYGKQVFILCGSRPLQSYKLSIDDEFLNALKGKYEEDNRFIHIDLKALSEEDICEMIAKSLGYHKSEIDESFTKEIFAQSEGMPFFASEILDIVKRKDFTERLENGKIGWRQISNSNKELRDYSTNFSTIGELILHRIDVLDDFVRKTLQVGAILGADFDLWDVIAVFECLSSIVEEDKTIHAQKVQDALNVAVHENVLDEYIVGGRDGYNQEDSQRYESNERSDLQMMARFRELENKQYRFSHDMWKMNLLSILLSSRKRDIHQCAASAFEARNIRDDRKDFRSLVKLFGHWKASGNSSKAAPLAIQVGKSFEELGLYTQCVNIYTDALEEWHCKQTQNELQITSIKLMSEIKSEMLDGIGVLDLKSIISLYIALGKVLANLVRGKESAAAYQKGLWILRHAHASKDLKDRSIAFPIFSGLFLSLKFGNAIEQDSKCSYEQELVQLFVKETKLNGCPAHYTRALAMQGEMYGRLGNWEKALESHCILEQTYNADDHSALVCKIYGSDRSAQSFGQSASWYYRLGNVNKALEVCYYVLDTLMPKMERRNVHNSMIMIYPVLWILKDNCFARKARTAFDEYCVQAFNIHYGKDASTPCLPLYKPIMTLLDLASNGEDSQISSLDNYIEWAIEIDNIKFSNGLNGAMANLGRDGSSISAEICLLLAKRLKKGKNRDQLLRNGLELSKESIDRTAGKNGSVGLINAYHQIKNVHNELNKLCHSEFGYSETQVQDVCEDLHLVG